MHSPIIFVLNRFHETIGQEYVRPWIIHFICNAEKPRKINDFFRLLSILRKHWLNCQLASRVMRSRWSSIELTHPAFERVCVCVLVLVCIKCGKRASVERWTVRTYISAQVLSCWMCARRQPGNGNVALCWKCAWRMDVQTKLCDFFSPIHDNDSSQMF